MSTNNSSKEISSGSDFNIDYSSDSESNKSMNSNNELEFNSSSEVKNNIFINKTDSSSRKDSVSDEDLIIKLFNSRKETNNLDSESSTKDMSTSVDMDEIVSFSPNSNSEDNYDKNNIINVNLEDSSKQSGSELSTYQSSVISDSLVNDKDNLSENSDTTVSINKKIIIKEVEDNMISVGTNTEDMVMTLKIPFDTSNVINVNEISLGNISNSNYNDTKKKELEELKKTLIKKNELKMQRMFDMLLEKQNNEIENDINNIDIGINPKLISKKQSKQITTESNGIVKQNLPNFPDPNEFIKQNINKNLPKNNHEQELSNSDESSNNNSDPFRMIYNINKKDEESQSDEEKREKFLKKRKKELKLMGENYKKEQEINIVDNSSETSNENNVTVQNKKPDETNKNEDFENKNEDFENKNEDFEKRKALRKERYLARRGFKKNIISSLFDKVYIITMKEDEFRSKQLSKLLDNLGVKHQISYGINPNENAYLPYLQRWLHQKDFVKYPLNKITFDHNLYLRRYPDLEEKGIKNKTRAWHHYVTAGKNEGRFVYEKTNIKNIAQLGCLLAHNRIYIDAEKNNYKSILILEDDVYLHNNFLNELDKTYEKIPKNWNILYFGGIQKKWTEIKSFNSFYAANNTLGAFAYGIRDTGFNYLKKSSMNLIDPIDICMQKLSNRYVIYPNIIITNLEKSRIHRSRDINFYAKVFKWNLDNFDLELYDNINEED